MGAVELYAAVKKLNYKRYKPMTVIAELADCSTVWVWMVFNGKQEDAAVLQAARVYLAKVAESKAARLASVSV